MYYERSKKIEDRFKRVVDLLRAGEATLNEVTKELGVSRPTFYRMIAELKRRKFRIRVIREGAESRYQIIYLVDRTTHEVISKL
jgi:Mn-dependent DtxR family transcriptional regulator